ncbi:MAG TPA: 6-bladed beta-propeller, partial [Nitrososphaeraceae archaeon]|nr:6-bladed beta-propeller [Nitrososphaeraceae archaeon]
MKNEYYFKILFGISLFSLGIIILFNDAFSDKGKDYLMNYYYLDQFGGKGSGDGQFNAPHSIDIDKFGSVYVTDTGNNRVQKFTSDGKFVLKWGDMGTGDGQFLKLHDLAVDPSGKYVYTVELKNHRVQKFTSDGKFVLKWGFENTGGKGAERTP